VIFKREINNDERDENEVKSLNNENNKDSENSEDKKHENENKYNYFTVVRDWNIDTKNDESKDWIILDDDKVLRKSFREIQQLSHQSKFNNRNISQNNDKTKSNLFPCSFIYIWYFLNI
jgi:hypothetical protein